MSLQVIISLTFLFVGIQILNCASFGIPSQDEVGTFVGDQTDHLMKRSAGLYDQGTEWLSDQSNDALKRSVDVYDKSTGWMSQQYGHILKRSSDVYNDGIGWVSKQFQGFKLWKK